MFVAAPDMVDYCPRCGKEVSMRYGDGGVKCENCNLHFYIVEGEDSEVWERGDETDV